MFGTAPQEHAPRSRADTQRSFLIRSDRSSLVVPLVLFCLLYVFLIFIITMINDGKVVYTLDDPYIHLALAENIVHGHYGVNASEMSAPSSSILWPLLLAPASALPYGHLFPLLVNLLASIGVLVMVHRLASRAYEVIEGENGKKNELVAVTLIFMMLTMNLLGLAFTGMEHSLQLFFAVAIVMGLIHEQNEYRVPWWFACALVIGPLIRYENLFLSAPALIYLLRRKHYYAAVLCGGILGGTLAGFSLFLYTSGLGVLPTSILVKTDLSSNTSSTVKIFANLLTNLYRREGTLLLVGVLLLLVHRRSEHRYLVVWASIATGLHIVFGKISSYGRYEIYVWASMLLVLIYIYGESIYQTVFSGSNRRSLTIIVVLLVALGMPYLYVLVTTPFASNNIYEQQYQMHRFAVEYYDAPVAVNDLGWVSYQNENYVLDLWGLASRETLMQRYSKGTMWMDRMMREYNVKFAMIYDSWFKQTPPGWVPVAKLHLGSAAITPDDSVVTFYALDQTTAQQVQPVLRSFKADLPPGVQFVLEDGAQ